MSARARSEPTTATTDARSRKAIQGSRQDVADNTSPNNSRQQPTVDAGIRAGDALTTRASRSGSRCQAMNWSFGTFSRRIVYGVWRTRQRSGSILYDCNYAQGNEVAKLNENVCAQIERAAELLRQAATRHRGKIGQAATLNPPNADEFIDVAASLEAIVKRERRIAHPPTKK